MSALAALLPSLGVGFLFWLAVRAMIQGDRRERAALARLQAEEKERLQRERTSSEEGPDARPDITQGWHAPPRAVPFSTGGSACRRRFF